MIRLLVLAIAAITTAAHAQPLPAEIIERDKPYGGHPRQLMDVAARPLDQLKPAILIVHGGSWQSGDKRTAVSKTKFFLQEGFAVAALNYRLHPEVTPREQAEDVAGAAVWLAKNADRYGIDPRQIYVAGHASGAHIAALVGTDPYYLAKHGAKPSDLGGVIAIDAEAYDIPAELGATTLETSIGRTLRNVFTDNAAFWPVVSPAYQTAKADALPPFFIVHSAGTQNDFRQAKPFAAQLRRNGAVAVVYEAIGRDRESVYRYFGSEGDAMTEAAITFIRREANIIISQDEKKADIPDVPWLFAFEAGEEDLNGRNMTGTEITRIVTHEGRLFAGNAHKNDTENSRRGQVLRLDSREDHWELDYQMPRGFSRASSLEPVSFETDFEGMPIERLDYLLVGGAFDKKRGQAAPAGLFIRTPSGNWTKQEIGSSDAQVEMVSVDAIHGWRDPKLKRDTVLIGAGPAPLGITRGLYDPAAIGGIRFDPVPEFTPRGQEKVRGFAVCNGRMYAATDRQILQRQDGARATWEVLLDLEDLVATRPYLENLDIYWQKAYHISSFRCDRSRSKTTLAFTSLNRAFRYSPGDERPILERDLANLLRTDLGREPHYIQAHEATTIKRRGRDLEEWIGIEVYYDPDYLIARPTFPYWRTGFGKDAWYLVRTVVGGQTSYRLEEVFVPGNDPNQRPLAKIADFERSPFEKDNAIYVGGFSPWFEEVSDTAWIARGEL
ncbi:alpha/beta hydrolase [Parvularcula sp. ZS-1/3]|uniref:Alpha/beta hydrolase n=1 Tax=Parvularcula mediterranea TaxID=2732508 RepID=A0A7Y3RMV6_9PROT|nr:alpha/beta hydrolase [Parvularcula mediterranea]NNU16994.1 alpha/beta hydrolase [Parvularcula mediterranea]